MDGEEASREADAIERRATTPVAGAIAGIAFAVLFTTSIVVLQTTMGAAAGDTGAWLETGIPRLRFALGLVPFAGLAFLWFIGVARQRLGHFEDQFFTTVFLGSGFLFLAMVFAAAANVGALVASYSRDATFVASTTYVYARNSVTQIFSIYALRMGAVFLFSQGTLWLRTGVMPRWFAYVTYVMSIAMMLVVTQSPWAVLVFPAWVFAVSTFILVTHVRRAATH